MLIMSFGGQITVVGSFVMFVKADLAQISTLWVRKGGTWSRIALRTAALNVNTKWALKIEMQQFYKTVQEAKC